MPDRHEPARSYARHARLITSLTTTFIQVHCVKHTIQSHPTVNDECIAGCITHTWSRAILAPHQQQPTISIRTHRLALRTDHPHGPSPSRTLAWFTAAPAPNRVLTTFTSPLLLAMYSGVLPNVCPAKHNNNTCHTTTSNIQPIQRIIRCWITTAASPHTLSRTRLAPY
jgi:hypothetical protein